MTRVRTSSGSDSRYSCAGIVRIVANHKGIDPNCLISPTRSRSSIAVSRQLAMYLCHVLLGLNLTQVGRYFGRDRTTVSHACATIEDMRENPMVDTEIQLLEDRITDLIDAEPNVSREGHANAAL